MVLPAMWRVNYSIMRVVGYRVKTVNLDSFLTLFNYDDKELQACHVLYAIRSCFARQLNNGLLAKR